MNQFIAIIGRSNSGKTTLIEKIVTHFTQKGYRIAVVKHTHHNFDIDHPGKDSYRFKEAGAHSVVLLNNEKFVLVSDIDNTLPPFEMVRKHIHDETDLIIAEGFKGLDIPMIEVIGDSPEPPLYTKGIENISAIVTDKNPEIELQHFRRDDIENICNYIEEKYIRK